MDRPYHFTARLRHGYGVAGRERRGRGKEATTDITDDTDGLENDPLSPRSRRTPAKVFAHHSPRRAGFGQAERAAWQPNAECGMTKECSNDEIKSV